MKMYKKEVSVYRNIILTVLLLTVIIFLFVSVLNNTSHQIAGENMKSTEAAIRKALVTCFAVEGFYPSEINYLEKYYGLVIDWNKYDLYYNLYADNLLPYYKLVTKGSSFVE